VVVGSQRRETGAEDPQPYCKDGIIQAVVHGNKNASVGSLDRYNYEKQLRGPGDLSFLSSEAGEVSQPP
jgi:hypothetical protein